MNSLSCYTVAANYCQMLMLILFFFMYTDNYQEVALEKCKHIDMLFVHILRFSLSFGLMTVFMCLSCWKV